ncbi:polysaccharide deacetylase [Rhizodiscina lignyota]|uniref:chitin deacetylase n=1 Tax=Rhizodiscina lignyota TaxID=1504668 RepID=A0A9P4ITB7_9PEZI|nr:polysaccharide deacetylase [Rhizodiscina lignyota]
MPRLFSVFRLPSKLQRRARRSRIRTMIVLLMVVCLFITPFYFIYKPPTFLIRYFQRRWPDVLWNVPTESKIVALTIDDGPSEYTTEIMRLLKENEAAATFFIIGGQVSGREKVLQDLIRNGNELGNHAMHDEPSRSLSDNTLVEEIHSVEEMLSHAYSAVDIAPPPKYFRPGSGFFSTKMRETLKRLGYRLVLGSVYPHDPQISMWKVNANHILSMVRPGSIIICHDRRPWTVPMLKTVLPELRQRGYRIMTVTELLKALNT